MKRILLFIMAITFSLAPFAQNHTAQKKPVRKTAVTAKKKAATPARKTNSRSHAARKTYKPAAPTSRMLRRIVLAIKYTSQGAPGRFTI